MDLPVKKSKGQLMLNTSDVFAIISNYLVENVGLLESINTLLKIKNLR